MRWVLVGVLTAPWLGGCGSQPPPEPRNLIVISLDTLRGDRLGCYGYERDTSPTIDSLAAEGLLFEDASATSPWTKPSHASLFTGLYPRRNGVIGFRHPMAEDVQHIAAWLTEQDFETAAIVSNSVLTTHGLERGFEHFEFTQRAEGPEPSEVTPRAIQWLEGRDRSKRFFAFIHYFDLHAEYRALPRYEEMFVAPYEGIANGKPQQLFAHLLGAITYDERDARHLANLYDAALRQLDDQVAELLAYLRDEDLLEESLLIVTSDHGEEFLEHGGVHHGLTQFEESVRIPLVFHGPGIPAGSRLAEPVSLVDVMPTALALLGVPVPAGLDGVELQPLWEQGRRRLDSRWIYLEADCKKPTPETRVLELGSSRAIRNERFKLHYDADTKEVALYDLANDPGETEDVQERFPDVVRAMRRTMRRFLNTARRKTPPEEFTPEDIERLEALGYAGSGGEQDGL